MTGLPIRIKFGCGHSEVIHMLRHEISEAVGKRQMRPIGPGLFESRGGCNECQHLEFVTLNSREVNQ